ncbi:two-component system chemotaxis response regulator CheB [Rhodovulum imhoffii]|uniref:protein-glutamate methylesterase n=1 Tax=Rhodovulum imhoffii TaxID=365340 RepID=A0A2T5BRG6_9RHOB|nr:CheB methylesterase domain-containing protein [Rhodovulum imhoffii]MBK5933995.1 hypothetical protein [Rhodovulum imhoffii]PTN01880.1 two-component system chemotaxis response regulator CheB [Rhodovulum imhoffii]
MAQIDTIIASPSPVECRRLQNILEKEPDFRILAQARDLSQTYTATEALSPAIVLISQSFAALPEFEVMHMLFRVLDTRWLVIENGDACTPHLKITRNSDLFTIDLRSGGAGLVPLIRSVTRAQRRKMVPARPVRQSMPGQKKLVMIGASTGGVDALATLLSGFPTDCPPTMIVQHTRHSFGGSLIGLLDRQCAAHVMPAKDRMRLDPGTICIAAGGRAHMQLAISHAPQVRLVPSAPVSGHLPSVDAMFHSALRVAPRTVAVLLTGMGRDGARGMLELRQAGASTLAQDEASSVVYGMPKAAWENGGAQKRIPLVDMAAEILKAASMSGEEAKP